MVVSQLLLSVSARRRCVPGLAPTSRSLGPSLAPAVPAFIYSRAFLHLLRGNMKLKDMTGGEERKKNRQYYFHMGLETKRL